MRIAIFGHFYPPTPCGGAGYYTAALAEGLQLSGQTVEVLCADRWGEGPKYFNGFIDENINQVQVRRLHVNWLKAPRPLDWLYDSPVLGEQAQHFLAEFKPDVVHVSSCYTLSARPVLVAREMRLPIVMHLHDYWHICARHTLLHKDDTVCSGPESTRKCQQCVLAGTKAETLTGKVLNASQQAALFENLSKVEVLTRVPSLRGMLGDFARRREITLTACAAADVLITPTRFARDLLVANGVPAERLQVMNCGNRVEWAADVQRTSADRLRVGFLGNVINIKGVHVLIDAYRQLSDRARVQLQIWGNTEVEPAYYAAQRASAPADVIWGGRYTHADLARILSNLDVLVVPSIWYEMQGLIIQEAFAAGVPAIVSDQTSLTETVTPEQNGLYFQRGSAPDLARQLQRLLAEPDLLPHLRSNILPVRTLDQDVQRLTALYAELTNRIHPA